MRARTVRRLLAGAAVVAAVLLAPPAASSTAPPTVERLAGADRYATAAAVSAATFTASAVPVAYVATGEAYADALAGGPAAAHAGGPVLLTQRDTLPAVTAAELDRLKPKRIVVLGGPSAVSDAVTSALGGHTSGAVTRISGADRFATAAAVSTAAFTTAVPTVYVASGESYADALPGSAVGAASGSPVLLAGRDLLPEATKGALRALTPKNVVVLGGRSSISSTVEDQLTPFASVGVLRFSGEDRFATSAVISQSSFSRPRPVAYVTTGLDFPDGLAAGAVAGVTNAPLLLVRPDCMPDTVKAELDQLAPAKVVVVGGATAVSSAAASGQAVCQPPAPTGEPVPSYSGTDQVTAAFYYGWYPGNWFGITPHYLPSDGRYDSLDSATVRRHIDELRYAGMQAAIASWWGPGHGTDRALPVDLRESQGTPLAWTVYYELEGPGYIDPSVSQIKEDLDYLSRYTSHPNWLHRDGKPVIFVWPDDNDGCAMAQRWREASAGEWYVVQKRFIGWTSCQDAADSWHEYGPGAKQFDVRPWSFVVSPGFWRWDLDSPWLTRDPERFDQSVAAMKASGAQWQLVTTFNEWVEGTAVEPAPEWQSESGYGVYLDTLNRHYGSR